MTTHPDCTYILQNSLTKKDVVKKQKTKKDKSAKVNGLQHDLYLLVTLFLSIDACGNLDSSTGCRYGSRQCKDTK